ncbi:META domain-containing protein [Streptomyces sp. SCSIO 30461]|uniref:META domain-containing protein n=1 Tax=Streptomyces sp. SCSIO 30461 TaxID=3118085 RepID=UPI0030CB2E70
MRTKQIVPGTTGQTMPLTLALTALLALTACGTEKGPGSEGASEVRPEIPVTGVHWTVDSVTVDGRKTAAPEGAHVLIDTKGRAEGNFGCNHFGADATVDGSTITVGQVERTEMGCAKDVDAFERTMTEAFSGKLDAKRSDGSLTLTTERGDSIALTEQQPAPLVGTKWTVTALLTGDRAASVPVGAEKRAFLELGRDGSVRGNLGCNTFSGTAKVSESGSTITFGRLATTRRMCAPPQMTLEGELSKVLRGTVSYELDHRRLSLTGSADDGSGKGAEATAP